MQNALIFNPSVSLSRYVNLKLGISLKKLMIFDFILIACLLFLYIFQINKTVEGSYSLKDYQVKARTLAEENRTLESQTINSNSLSIIEASALDSNFERVTNIKYIQSFGNAMVVNDALK